MQHNPESWRCFAKRDTQQETQISTQNPGSPTPSQASGPLAKSPIGTSSAPSTRSAGPTPAPSSGPWPASAWPRGTIAPVCRECGGRRVISSAAGPLPCPSCITWQRRPDYKRDEPLLTVKDLDLNSLDVTTTTPSGTGRSFSDEDKIRSDTESGTDEDEDGRPRDRRGQMTEQKRLAIKLAMQGRGPLASDHKRRISNAMRERYASDPSMRQLGKPKKCSHCGEMGHNRKKCPELRKKVLEESSGAGKEEQLDEIIGKLDPKAISTGFKRTCSVCGKLGHNKRSCPEAAQQNSSVNAAQSPSKVIIIEEESESEEEEEAEPTQEERGAVGDSRGQNITKSSASNQPSLGREGATPGGQRTLPPSQKSAPPKTPPPFASPVPRRSPQDIPSSPSPMLRTLPGSDLALTEDGSLVFPLPPNPEQCVAQAAGAVLRAWGDGIRRQSLELLLPQSGQDAGDAWPGGIRQQFRAALPMIESLLLRLKRAEGLEGRITAEWLDEGDCAGAWQSERLAAVVFPTADTLSAVRRIDDALSGKRLMLVVNSQWQPQGQVVSDFGFGRSRKVAERYIDSLEEVYYLRRVRVLGDEVRVLRCYPAQWQVYYVRSAGETELVAVEHEKPTYQRLLELLQNVRDSRASKSWLDRALDRRWYDDIGAYSERSSLDEEDGVIRDIITGEIIGRRNSK